MKIRTSGILSILLLITFAFSTCTYDKGSPDYNSYPEEIGKLIFTKCATAGCHNEASKGAAGGLSLQSWNSLFAGGRSGAAVIPYRSDYSTFFYFTNTFPDLGVTLKPTMPYNKPPLSREEVLMLKGWIDAGAPDKDGFVKFSDDPGRKKFYVTNQGCDVVTVFDQASGVQMRYVNVGQNTGNDAPHMIRVSPDRKFWYVLSLTGTYLEKYSAVDDKFVGKAFIGGGSWNAFIISSDSQTAYCSDLNSSGKIAIVNLSSMTAFTQAPFNYPHGVALNNTDDTLYVTQQFGSSRLYKVPVSDFSSFSEIDLDNATFPAATPLNSHEIVFSPDGSKYYVTCQGTNEVRVVQTGSDQVIASIPVGNSPTEMAFSANTPYLFVSCTEDTLNFPGKRGSVAVINRLTNSVEKYIYTGHQPHGIAVDDAKKIVIVANRNFATDGPAPHHSSACGGRNGNVSFINISTLQLVNAVNSTSPKRIEVAVDPYSVGIR